MSDERLRQLELQLVALHTAHRQKAAQLGRLWRERAGTPGHLLMAGVAGAGLALIGSSRNDRRRRDPEAAAKCKTGTTTLLGSVIAAAGALGSAQRLTALVDLLLKSTRRD